MAFIIQAVGRQYRNKRAVLEQYSALEFKKDSLRISLDVKDTVTTSGWEIMALAPPLIVSKPLVCIIIIMCLFGYLDYQKWGRWLHWQRSMDTCSSTASKSSWKEGKIRMYTQIRRGDKTDTTEYFDSLFK